MNISLIFFIHAPPIYRSLITIGYLYLNKKIVYAGNVNKIMLPIHNYEDENTT